MMLWVNSAQVLLLWFQRSLRLAPFSVPGTPSTSPTLVKPLLPNGAALKLIGGRPGASGTPGAALLLSPAKAPSAVISPPSVDASAKSPTPSAAPYWPTSALRTAVATGVLKQVGEAPGARIVGAAAAKLVATIQLVKRL